MLRHGLPLFALLTACTTQTLEPTLTAIHSEVFNISCAQSSCHGGSNPEEDLDLTSPEAAFASLVGVDGHEADMVRVVPFDAENSLLYQCLLGEVEGVSLMPEGAIEPIDQYKIDGIKQWIDDGAEQN